MRENSAFSVRECAVTAEPLLQDAEYDYADSFELVLQRPDAHSAPEWMQLVVENASPAVMALVAFVHTRVARFRAGADDESSLPGWRLARSEADVVMLVTTGPLLRATIVVRRGSSTRLTFTTFLFYGRARTARRLWFVIRPLHQRVARYLLENAAASLQRKGRERALPSTFNV